MNRNYFNEASMSANERYLSANGDEFEGFDDELSADGGEMAQVPTSQPYIITVQNTSTVDVTNVTVLGANFNAAATNQGNSSAIVISLGVSNMTYTNFLYQTISQPFKVGLTYIFSTDATQLLETFTVRHDDAQGNFAGKLMTPQYDIYQQIQTAVVLRQAYTADGNTQIIISRLYAGKTVKINLYPADVFNSRRTLLNDSPMKKFGNPRIIGQQTLRIDK